MDDKRLTRGIYKRGNLYWLNVQKDNHRAFLPLKTGDLATAIPEGRTYPALATDHIRTLAGKLC